MEPFGASVILLREWEAQMSSSGCCGRIEGDFLKTRECEPIFAERRATMDAMGTLYRALRDAFGARVRLEVVDPRNWASLVVLLIRDFRTYHVGFGEALRTLIHLPVCGVFVNGRLVARGEAPDPGELIERLGASMAETAATT